MRWDRSLPDGRRWLVVTSLSCNDTLAVNYTLELLAHYGESAGLRAQLNYFDAVPREPCPGLRRIRNAPHLFNPYVASLTFVPGFKTLLWRTLTPQLTASYAYVWLRDSDVVTTPRLLTFSEVEHWMRMTTATVAAPSVLPLDNAQHSHGWWTPFRASFAGSCLVQTSPIVEQMSPIFRRDVFDAFRRRLLLIPERVLATDFGLETYWCGFRWNESARGASDASSTTRTPCKEVDRRLAAGQKCGARIAWSRANLGLDAAAARAKVRSEYPLICSACAAGGRTPSGAPPSASASSLSRCILINHVSVVHANHRTIEKHQVNWSSHMAADAPDDLRAYLTQRWPSAMFRFGDPSDRHHRLHVTRCWGEWAASEGELVDGPLLKPSARPTTALLPAGAATKGSAASPQKPASEGAGKAAIKQAIKASAKTAALDRLRAAAAASEAAAACSGLLDDGGFDTFGLWCCAATCGTCKQEEGCGARSGGRFHCCPMAMRRKRLTSAVKRNASVSKVGYTSPALDCGFGYSTSAVNRTSDNGLFCRVPWAVTSASTINDTYRNETLADLKLVLPRESLRAYLKAHSALVPQHLKAWVERAPHSAAVHAYAYPNA